MISNTQPPSNRRSRQRAQTIAQIKASARRQIAEEGAQSVSLRAIARDIDLSPAAIYRYFSSLDDLREQLACDIYDDLIFYTRDTMDIAGSDPLSRATAWVEAFRRWALTNSRDFETLLFLGDETKSQRAFGLPDCDCNKETKSEACQCDIVLSPVHVKSLEHSKQCGGELAALWAKAQAGEFVPYREVPMPPISRELENELLWCRRYIVGSEIPLNWMYAFTTAWVRFFGMIVMEVSGNSPILHNLDEFYSVQIKSVMAEMGFFSIDN